MRSFLSRFRWSVAPDDATPVQRRNFRYVQIDAIGIGLANAASPFLPVFLTRMGASNFQIGLLTAMPAATGLVLAIIVGNFLQKQRNVVPWFSFSRLLVISSYAATGLVPFLVPDKLVIQTVLLIWAVATLPQTAVAVCFSVVMNAVAGPTYRYDLMSRRWALLGLVTALTVAVAGQVLDRIGFPLNYQVVFIALSLGGLVSYIFSSRIQDLQGIGGGQVKTHVAIHRGDGLHLYIRVCQRQQDGMGVVHAGIGIDDQSFHFQASYFLTRFISSVC